MVVWSGTAAEELNRLLVGGGLELTQASLAAISSSSRQKNEEGSKRMYGCKGWMEQALWEAAEMGKKRKLSKGNRNKGFYVVAVV